MDFLTVESILPMIKIFWTEYASLRKFGKEESKEKLIKTLNYMAVRMIQTAFENNPTGNPVSNNSLKLIHFCDQLLANPEEVATQWNLLS